MQSHMRNHIVFYQSVSAYRPIRHPHSHISTDDIHSSGFCDSDSNFVFESCGWPVSDRAHIRRSIQTSHVGDLLPWNIPMTKVAMSPQFFEKTKKLRHIGDYMSTIYQPRAKTISHQLHYLIWESFTFICTCAKKILPQNIVLEFSLTTAVNCYRYDTWYDIWLTDTYNHQTKLVCCQKCWVHTTTQQLTERQPLCVWWPPCTLQGCATAAHIINHFSIQFLIAEIFTSLQCMLKASLLTK
jgi:hypothetical protein